MISVLDFKLGTTASDGIEAGDIQYDDDLEPDLAPIADVYDNDYEVFHFIIKKYHFKNTMCKNKPVV